MSVTLPSPASFYRYIGAALIVALLQTGVIGYMIAGRAAILRSGTEILLKTAPVDPRDLLRGDYVILNYDISTIPLDKIVGPKPADVGNHPLWVRLTKGGDGFWGVVEASFQELPPQSGNVVVKANSGYPLKWMSGSDLNDVRYGIERFYVPEGEGLELEKARGTEQLAVAVKVSESGTAQIRTLLLDGRPIYDEPLY